MSYGNICNLCRGYTANEQTMCEEVGATSWKNVCKCVCHMAKAEEGKEPPIKKHRDTCHHKSGPNADKEHLWDYANDLRCRCICTCPQPIEESPSPNCSCGLIIMGNTLKHRKDCALNRVEKPVEHEFDCPKQKCGGNPTCPNHDCTCKKPVEEEYQANNMFDCDECKKKVAENKADWWENDLICLVQEHHALCEFPMDKRQAQDKWQEIIELLHQTILSERKEAYERGKDEGLDFCNNWGHDIEKYIQQGRKAEREEIVKLVEGMLKEVKPLYIFGDFVIDSQKAQDGTILGQQKALSDLLTLLESKKG